MDRITIEVDVIGRLIELLDDAQWKLGMGLRDEDEAHAMAEWIDYLRGLLSEDQP